MKQRSFSDENVFIKIFAFIFFPFRTFFIFNFFYKFSASKNSINFCLVKNLQYNLFRDFFCNFQLLLLKMLLLGLKFFILKIFCFSLLILICDFSRFFLCDFSLYLTTPKDFEDKQLILENQNN